MFIEVIQINIKMKQREIREGETTWQCVQAYHGLKNTSDIKTEDLTSNPGNVEVICTPSGGAKTRRITLPSTWAEDISDEDLRAAIRSGTTGQ
jgi:hypothetical protein